MSVGSHHEVTVGVWIPVHDDKGMAAPMQDEILLVLPFTESETKQAPLTSISSDIGDAPRSPENIHPFPLFPRTYPFPSYHPTLGLSRELPAFSRRISRPCLHIIGQRGPSLVSLLKRDTSKKGNGSPRGNPFLPSAETMVRSPRQRSNRDMGAMIPGSLESLWLWLKSVARRVFGVV